MTRRSVIAGVGSALPTRQVSNAELASQVDTTDEWIVERTGIRNRYIAGDGETTGSLAIDAARGALAHAGVDAAEIDLIVLPNAKIFGIDCHLIPSVVLAGWAAFHSSNTRTASAP